MTLNSKKQLLFYGQYGQHYYIQCWKSRYEVFSLQIPLCRNQFQIKEKDSAFQRFFLCNTKCIFFTQFSPVKRFESVFLIIMNCRRSVVCIHKHIATSGFVILINKPIFQSVHKLRADIQTLPLEIFVDTKSAYQYSWVTAVPFLLWYFSLK